MLKYYLRPCLSPNQIFFCYTVCTYFGPNHNPLLENDFVRLPESDDIDILLTFPFCLDFTPIFIYWPFQVPFSLYISCFFLFLLRFAIFLFPVSKKITLTIFYRVEVLYMMFFETGACRKRTIAWFVLYQNVANPVLFTLDFVYLSSVLSCSILLFLGPT